MSRPRPYGEQPRSAAGRHSIQTQVRSDVYLRICAVMRRHNLSASGAVHHALRLHFGLPPLIPIPPDCTHSSHHRHDERDLPHTSR